MQQLCPRAIIVLFIDIHQPHVEVTPSIHVFQDFAEGLQAELHQYDIDTQALSTGMKERMYKLLNSSSEVRSCQPLSQFSEKKSPLLNRT